MNNVKSKRVRGRVENFFPRRGFGFIIAENNLRLFVHYSSIRGDDFRTLEPDETVEFSIIETPKGLQAVEVVRLNPPQKPIKTNILDDHRTW